MRKILILFIFLSSFAFSNFNRIYHPNYWTCEKTGFTCHNEDGGYVIYVPFFHINPDGSQKCNKVEYDPMGQAYSCNPETGEASPIDVPSSPTIPDEDGKCPSGTKAGYLNQDVGGGIPVNSSNKPYEPKDATIYCVPINKLDDKFGEYGDTYKPLDEPFALLPNDVRKALKEAYENGETEVTFPDGTKAIANKSNNSIDVEHPDGSKDIYFDDNTIKHISKPSPDDNYSGEDVWGGGSTGGGSTGGGSTGGGSTGGGSTGGGSTGGGSTGGGSTGGGSTGGGSTGGGSTGGGSTGGGSTGGSSTGGGSTGGGSTGGGSTGGGSTGGTGDGNVTPDENGNLNCSDKNLTLEQKQLCSMNKNLNDIKTEIKKTSVEKLLSDLNNKSDSNTSSLKNSITYDLNVLYNKIQPQISATSSAIHQLKNAQDGHHLNDIKPHNQKMEDKTDLINENLKKLNDTLEQINGKDGTGNGDGKEDGNGKEDGGGSTGTGTGTGDGDGKEDGEDFGEEDGKLNCEAKNLTFEQKQLCEINHGIKDLNGTGGIGDGKSDTKDFFDTLNGKGNGTAESETSGFSEFANSTLQKFNNITNDFNNAKSLIENGFNLNLHSSNSDTCPKTAFVFGQEIVFDICTPFSSVKPFFSLFVTLLLMYQSIKLILWGLK
ncbi:hypothetical protein [Aliarcobacter thereius]|uniref:hypothetical protein n=1 Tax=Aliarcobacter thereius TaxID=544718 RepID=UPI001BB29497|nr:hypothetical protein [Aliarcobacter thereius]